MTTQATIAEVEHVTHHYGTTVALDDVSIEIPARRMIGLIGPDGVGKSTLLGLIAGVRIIQQGRVTVFGGIWPTGHIAPHRVRVSPICRRASGGTCIPR